MAPNIWSGPRYTVDCMDCSVDTYGAGDEWLKLAFDHARECPGHRVQVTKREHIVIQHGDAIASAKEDE